MKAITFDNTDQAKRSVLAILGKRIDKQGYIVDTKTGERVVTPNGEDVLLSDFAGVRKGSEIFITSDLPSLLEQAEYIEA